ncbi:MAG: EpsG family protein [Ruminococcus sp.]|nr:EpsG family protein [Ruminococcus sp.]
MTVYLILLSIALAGIPLCGLNGVSKGKKQLAYWIICAAVFTVVSAVRFSVGHDYNLYASWFYDLNFTDYEEMGAWRREKGLLLAFKALNSITPDYGYAFILISLMIYPPLMVLLWKQSSNLWVSMTAFLGMGIFFNSLNFMAQFIAAVICGFAFDYLRKGCLWRFAVLVILGCAFHKSAFILLPCALFRCVRCSKKTLAAALGLTAVLYVFSDDLIGFFTKYIYTNYDMQTSREMSAGLSPIYCVMFGIVFLTGFLLRDRMDCSEEKTGIMLWSSFAAFFFELMGTKHGVISRFALLFFIPGTLLLIPEIFNTALKLVKGGKAGKAAVTAAFAVLMCVNCGVLLSRNYNGVVPYNTVFSSEGGAAYGR